MVKHLLNSKHVKWASKNMLGDTQSNTLHVYDTSTASGIVKNNPCANTFDKFLPSWVPPVGRTCCRTLCTDPNQTNPDNFVQLFSTRSGISWDSNMGGWLSASKCRMPKTDQKGGHCRFRWCQSTFGDSSSKWLSVFDAIEFPSSSLPPMSPQETGLGIY